MLKRLLLLSLLLLPVFALESCNSVVTLEAQTLPYQLTVAWDASPDAANGYNCYLDGVKQTSVATGVLTCSFPVPTLGQHTASVTAVNNSDVPSESAPASVTFTLKAPAAAANVKVK